MEDALLGASSLGSSHGSSPKYRPDIDGLRAVAVLIVVVFHMRATFFSGGFVGVDVFFVISGYLISSIVLAEVAAHRFRVIGFYERRIRRIFPALFAMLISFSIFAGIYFLPGELVTVAKSVLAATLSASNFYFLQHSGYFDPVGRQPMLHTWSLAVEEQFYICFPIFLMLVQKFFPRRLRASVIVLFFASLIASAILTPQNSRAAFYMLPTRTWELLLGTLLALRMFPPLRSRWQRDAATLLGIGLISYAAHFYSQGTVFPGLAALTPCIGSALIVGAGESGSSLVGAALSWRPVVFIGLISYSLYLWHWPVIALHRMGLLFAAPAKTLPYLSAGKFAVLAELTLSFLLAVLSWRFVERPFRTGPLKLSGRPLFASAAAVMAALVLVSTSTILDGGFQRRFPASALQIAAGPDDHADRLARFGVCFIGTKQNTSYDYNLCLREDSAKTNYLLLGDSHAAAIWYALSSLLPGANVMQFNFAGCTPLLSAPGSPPCRKVMSYIFQTYLPSHPVHTLLAARWYDNQLDELTRTIAWMREHHIPVTLLGPSPEYDSPLPWLLAYSIAWNDPGLAARHRIAKVMQLDATMQSMAANVWRVPYISLYQEICRGEQCILYADRDHRIPFMRDEDHLSLMGASLVVRQLVDKGELP